MRKFRVRFVSVAFAVIFLTVSLIVQGDSKLNAFLFKQSESGVLTQNTTLAQLNTDEIVDYRTLNYKNAYEYLMARDGFIYGIDYDWMFVNTNSSHNLGDNRILGFSSAYNEYLLTLDVYNMRAMGYNCMNMWLFTDGQGIIFDDDGLVIGLTDTFENNLRSWLQICRKVGIFACVSIQPHGEASNYGNGNGNETPREIWNKYFRFYYEPTARKAYMDNAIKPLCQILSEYQDVVAICDLTVENTSNLTDDAELGYFRNSSMKGSTWENMFSFMKDMNSVIKSIMPDMVTSTENMGNSEFQYRCNELGVDLIGQNRYNSDGVAKDPTQEYLTKPTYIGEFNGGESGFDAYSQEYWGKIKANFYPSAYDQGYKGAFYFSYSTGGSPFVLYDGISTDYSSMRVYALTLSYQINDMVKKYQKNSENLDKPILLFNKGGEDIYWIPGRGVSLFKIERSDDQCKTWKTIADKIDVYDISLDNGLCKYTDNGLKSGDNFCYRITAYDDNGKSIVSSPNNSADYFIPQELLKDRSFESGEIASSEIDSGWFGSKGAGKIVENGDVTASDGSHYFICDKSNGIGSGSYNCIYQKVKVSKNTSYQLKFDLYGVCNANMSSVQIYYKNSEGVLTVITGSSSWLKASYSSIDEDIPWLQKGILFSTGDFDEIYVRISNGDSPNAIFRVDNFTLKESR